MAQIILDSSNNLIQGDFDNATVNNRTKFKTTTLNATTNVYAVPNGSATSAGFSVSNAADPTNASKITIATNGSTDTQIISGVNGTGTYLPLSFYTNNALAAQITTAGNLTVTGSVTANQFLFPELRRSIARIYDESVGDCYGMEQVSAAQTGTVPSLRLFSSSAASAGMSFGKYTNTTSFTNWLVIGNTGRTYIPNAYTETTGNSANLFVDTDGRLIRATSSLKYKTNVQDATHGLNEVMQLRSVTYKGKEDGDKVFGGLIAEEVHEAGLTEFVQYAEDGTPDALAYGNMVSLLTKAIQEQQAIINKLKTRIEALESK